MASDDFDDDEAWRRELFRRAIHKFRARLESDPHYVDRAFKETYQRILNEEVDRLIRSVNEEADEEPSNPALDAIRRAKWELLKRYEQRHGSGSE